MKGGQPGEETLSEVDKCYQAPGLSVGPGVGGGLTGSALMVLWLYMVVPILLLYGLHLTIF